MRIPRSRACGELLLFDEVRRRLRLGRPHTEGEATIRVDQIVGTVNRAQDFDGCFRPRVAHLAKRVSEIQRAKPDAVNEPIEVVRVDHAYFVIDGHKRVSIAKASGMEFIDANVSAAATEFHVESGVTSEAIDLTAQELRFREETALADAVPSARFAVSEPEGYAELREAVESYGFELIQRLGRVLSRDEVAAVWHECVYLPTVLSARRNRLPELLGGCTDADLFLTLHRQSRVLWGRECDVSAEDGDELVRKLLNEPIPDQSLVDRVVRRARRRPAPELLVRHD